MLVAPIAAERINEELRRLPIRIVSFRQQTAMVRPDERAGAMGRDEPDPADEATNGDLQSDDPRHERHDRLAQPSHIDAKRTGTPSELALRSPSGKSLSRQRINRPDEGRRRCEGSPR